jgi:hypothetical protein
VTTMGIDVGADEGTSAGDSDSEIGTGVEAGTIGKSGATVANCESGSVNGTMLVGNLGANDGASDGVRAGFAVVGARVGATEGVPVFGANDGASDGARDGFAVFGARVGATEGVPVFGGNDGANVGDGVEPKPPQVMEEAWRGRIWVPDTTDLSNNQGGLVCVHTRVCVTLFVRAHVWGNVRARCVCKCVHACVQVRACECASVSLGV